MGSAPFTAAQPAMKAELTWAVAASRVTMSLAPLLPDDPRDCAVDLAWP